jgi:hypothetical protein
VQLNTNWCYFLLFVCYFVLLRGNYTQVHTFADQMFTTPHFVSGDYKSPNRFLPADEYGRALDCLVKGMVRVKSLLINLWKTLT